MPYPYSVPSYADGTILTATIYNGENARHATENRPQSIDDLSGDLTAYRATTDPGEVGTEVLPVTLEEEVKRLRFAIHELKPGSAQWYSTGATQGDPVYAEVFGS
jgi:hypothetical protein